MDLPQPVLRKPFDLIGRICLAAVFVIAIPVKLTKFSLVADAIAERGIPAPIAPVLLVLAIVCLVAGSVLLIFGSNNTLGAALLLTFLVPTTLLFHLFPFQSRAVFMNLGVIGGLLMVLTRSELNEGR